MALTIKELRDAAAAINEAAGWLETQFNDTESKTTTDKEAKPALTLEQDRAVLADKSRAGHTAEIRALLKKYGAAKLSGVDPKDYEALLKDAEELK